MQDCESPRIDGPLLWLTVTHPGLRHAGNQVYSGGLLQALGECGQPITLLTTSTGPEIAGVTVETVPVPKLRPRALGLASHWPASVWRGAFLGMRRRFLHLLSAQPWRAVVIDQAACGWAAPMAAAKDLPIVYIAHNHEASVRPAIAAAEASRLKRAVLQKDARKYARLERDLVRHSAIVTAITAEDAAIFHQQTDDAHVLELPPGYGGQRIAERILTASVPRRVVLVGRFEWIAKQLNLIRWADEAVPHLAAQGIGTLVVGTVPDALRARVARDGLSFAGRVPNLAPFLADARFGLVAEDVGGGFKLKTLDYIFHRLPVAALADNLAGQPPGVIANSLTAEHPAALAQAIAATIDDLERLNQMQHNAYDAAAAAFDWLQRAERFLHALESVNRKE